LRSSWLYYPNKKNFVNAPYAPSAPLFLRLKISPCSKTTVNNAGLRACFHAYSFLHRWNFSAVLETRQEPYAGKGILNLPAQERAAGAG
jgi:hypothetical protein